MLSGRDDSLPVGRDDVVRAGDEGAEDGLLRHAVVNEAAARAVRARAVLREGAAHLRLVLGVAQHGPQLVAPVRKLCFVLIFFAPRGGLGGKKKAGKE